MTHSKHRSPGPSRDQRRLLGFVGGLAVVGGTVGAWAIMSSADAGPGGARRHTVAAETTPSSDGRGSSGTTTQPAGDRVAACRAEVAAGRAAADAANQSYQDWHAHVQAQLDLDAGVITRDQTMAIWADSKARGNSDVAAFNTTNAAYQEAAGPCGGSKTDTAGISNDCATAATAVAAAVSTGQKVNATWAAHMQMMADKANIGSMYNQMWRDMVKAAPADFDAFTTAYGAMLTAPKCT